MEITPIIMKLVGPIDPVGETYADATRLENLMSLTKSIEELLVYIEWIASNNKNRHEASMKKAGVHCDEFLDSIVREYGEER